MTTPVRSLSAARKRIRTLLKMHQKAAAGHKLEHRRELAEARAGAYRTCLRLLEDITRLEPRYFAEAGQ